MSNGEIPGFIDLQVNGFRGVDFASPKLSKADFLRACRELRSEGTAGFLPTLITSPVEVYERNLPLIALAIDQHEIKGQAIGFHLEGPFISSEPGARGVHNRKWIRKADIKFFDHLQELADGKIKVLTIAADIEGAEKLTQHVTRQGITVSLGHHCACEEDLQRLVDTGATSLTHLGNGVPRLLERHRNPIWAGLSQDELTAMIITDGHHLSDALIKTIVRTKSTERLVVVSDSSPIAGLAPGRYRSMGRDVVLESDGLLYDVHSSYLAGSSSTMLSCMNYLASLGFLEYDDLLQVGFYNPLRLIGIDPKEMVESASEYNGSGPFPIYLQDERKFIMKASAT